MMRQIRNCPSSCFRSTPGNLPETPDGYFHAEGLPARPKVEHKAEHNNCRMRAPEPDLQVLNPTVSC